MNPKPSVASDPPVDALGLIPEAVRLWHELRGLAHDHLQLAALETQQAGESLVLMLALGIGLGGLLLSAWLGLLGAILAALITLKWLSISSALLLAATLNLLGAFLLWGKIRQYSHHLSFPSYTRALQPPSDRPDEERLP